jgi:hypothetical protein
MRGYSRIAIATLLVLAIAAVLSYRSNSHIEVKPVSTSASAQQSNRATEHAKHSATRIRTSDLRLVAESPTSAAIVWMEHADAAITVRLGRHLGAEVANLAALPPAEAWTQLTQRARDGDVRAAAAAALLASECKRLLELRESPLPPSHYVEHATRNLPQEWIEFIAAIDLQQNARVAVRTDGCTGVGGMLDFAEMAIDRFIRPDDPQTQLWEVARMEDDKDAIALMRNLADRLGTEEARRDLGARLISSKIAAESAEGLAILESLAESDELADMTLIHCFRSGCGSVTPDPAIAIIWMEDAAGLGDPIGAQALQNELVTSGNNVEAWAWAMYHLELATAGCLEYDAPRPTWLVQDARRAFDLDHLLDTTQRAQAQALLQTIKQRWESLTMTNLGCSF